MLYWADVTSELTFAVPSPKTYIPAQRRSSGYVTVRGERDSGLYIRLQSLFKARGTFHLAAVVAARRVEVCGVYGVFRKQ